uniref:Uncharacterized protein n=1 Tax=Meloidogyne javanica TaxID=6303 RepID=A0A915N7Y7_MELJA
VVFRNGDGALQLLPTLVDIVPEARLNLAIYHLKKNDTDAAFVLMKNIEPQSTYEYLLKAITFCIKGIEENSQDLLNAAAGFFKIVGESPAECDTIIGRQSMASAHFLRKQFDEVLVYLDSIRMELGVVFERLFQDVIFLEDYLIAAKAFDEMEKRENRINNQQNYNYSKPKCAACIGVVKMFTADKCSLDELREAMRILERDKSSEAREAIKTINKWAMEVNVYF